MWVGSLRLTQARDRKGALPFSQGVGWVKGCCPSFAAGGNSYMSDAIGGRLSCSLFMFGSGTAVAVVLTSQRDAWDISD